MAHPVQEQKHHGLQRPLKGSGKTGGTRPVVWFDLTNLVRCLEFRTPTGIDRVDWVYARWLCRAGGIELRGCFVRGGNVIETDAGEVRRICRDLWNAWKSAQKAEKPGGIFASGFPGSLRRNLRSLLRPVTSTSQGRASWYLNVSQRNLANPGILRFLERTGAQAVCVIHDLLPVSHPQFFPRDAEANHRAKLDAMLAVGAILICSSRSLGAEIESYAAQAGYRPRVIASRFGVHASIGRQVSSPADEGPLLVHIATFEPRKNHRFLLDVWSDWLSSAGPCDSVARLVMVGRRGESFDEAVRTLQARPTLAGIVEIRTEVSDDEVNELLSRAAGILVPSIVEGYGLPLFDAFARGIPVVANDISVFRELGEGIPLLLPIDDTRHWVEALQRMASSEGERQRALLENWRRPTWAAHFRRLASAIAET